MSLAPLHNRGFAHNGLGSQGGAAKKKRTCTLEHSRVLRSVHPRLTQVALDATKVDGDVLLPQVILGQALAHPDALVVTNV